MNTENPFFVISNELIVLDSNICVAEIFLKMIRDIEAIGKRQQVTFKRHVFQIDKGVQSPIKRTEIPVFQFHTTNKKSVTAKKLEGLKYGASLFSRSYVLVMRTNYIHSPYLIRGY